MAGITQIQNPSLVQPVYNTAYMYVGSTNVSQPNFKYVFDVYAGSVVNNLGYQGRYKLLPRPGTNCLFSANRVLESLFSMDKPQNANNCIPNTNSLKYYSVYFGEEYGTNPVVISGVTQFYSGYTLGAAIQYNSLPTWNYSNGYTLYKPTGTTSQFLTNMPSSVYIRNDERCSISFLNIYVPTNLYPDLVKIRMYHTSGGSSVFQMSNTASTQSNGNTAYMLNHFGCGPWNLNQIPNNLLNIGAQPVFNANTDYKYTIELFDGNASGSTQISKTQTFMIDTRCSKYQPTRFMFRNSFGVSDYFTALLLSRQTTSINKTTYKKPLAYNYAIGDRGENVSDIDAQISFTVQTDWVNDLESAWLQEFFLSQEVYVLNSDGTLNPIIVNNNSVELKKSVNDKLYNYEFQYSYAYNVSTQRG